MKNIPIVLVVGVFLLLILIPVFSQFGWMPPLKNMTFELDGRKGKASFEFYPKTESRPSEIKPKTTAGKVSGDITVMSSDSSTILPFPVPIQGGEHVKVTQTNNHTQIWSITDLPPSGFQFAYNQPEPKRIKIQDTQGNIIYEGVPSVIGADAVTIAPQTT